MLVGKLEVDPTRRYSVIETAKLLGICRKTLDKYAREQVIHPVMHGPTKRMYYEGREIQRFYNCTI